MALLVHCADPIAPRVGYKTRGASMPVEFQLAKLVKDMVTFRNEFSLPPSSWRGVIWKDEEPVQLCWQSRFFSGSLNWEFIPDSVLLIDLRQNQINCTLNTSDLPGRLRQFHADMNRLHGEFDFCSLPVTLEKLTISKNFFTGNVELGAHLPPGLLSLEINSNEFTGDLSFCHLPKQISTLWAAYNFFSGPIVLQNLPPTLSQIDLRGNEFEGTLNLKLVPATLHMLGIGGNEKLKLKYPNGQGKKSINGGFFLR